MNRNRSKQLIVQADDFGCCPAVTDGIVAAFRAGVVSQTSLMAPAPDAARAARLAQRHGIPTGLHLTLICEWDYLRFYPLTPAPSLRAPDGAFLPGMAELRARADLTEVLDELLAQVHAVQTAGVSPTHLDCHIGVIDAGVLAQLAAETGLPCRDLPPAPGRPAAADSVWHLSLQPDQAKLERLLDHVSTMPTGRHMVVAHPALDRSELSEMCRRDSRRWPWARDIRLSDAAALTDPRFIATCAANGVQLTNVSGYRGKT